MAVQRKSTPVTIPSTVAHRKFGDLVRRTYIGDEHFIVEKDGLPVVVILSVVEYETLMAERERWEQDRQRRLQQFREATRGIGQAIADSGLTEEEIMAQLEETRQQVFDEYYGDQP